MVGIWLFHPKNFLNFYTFVARKLFLAACSLKKEPCFRTYIGVAFVKSCPSKLLAKLWNVLES
jgi:hypothetical protein